MKITKLCLCKAKNRPRFIKDNQYFCADCGYAIQDYEKQVLDTTNTINKKEELKNVKKDRTDIYITD